MSDTSEIIPICPICGEHPVIARRLVEHFKEWCPMASPLKLKLSDWVVFADKMEALGGKPSAEKANYECAKHESEKRHES
jgi:hypothetical protein